MPIRWRLTIFNSLAICSILLIFGAALYFLLRGALLQNMESIVQNQATAAARTVNSGDSLGKGDMEQLILNGVFIVVRDGHGHILKGTVNPGKEHKASDGVWRRALNSGKPASGTASLSRQAPDYVYAVPVHPGNGPARVVEAGKPYQSAQDTLEDFSTILAAGIGAAFVLSVAGAYLLARAALRPVDEVVKAAREMSEGDLDKRLPVVYPKDEIGRLAITINDFLSRMQMAFARREEALVRQKHFAADASHELRTPLTSIRGYAKMLSGWALEDREVARESVSAIDRESERMQGMVESLLALTRGDEGAPLRLGDHDLTVVAREATETARAVADGKVSLRYVPSQTRIEATFDRDRIRQAASILLDNAIKYTPQGGKVEIRAREEDGRAILEVSDTGVGISKDELPLIFERFYRADPSRTTDGAGLGLAIARQIAEAHGGEIRVQSKTGEGSTFTLSIPKNLLNKSR